MEQNKVKIIVACHKPVKVYCNSVYTPVHVGRAISDNIEEMKLFQGDDSGDNISCKNKSYCELTAQYWAWKNLDCEYIGLCHYRRYFSEEVTVNNIENITHGFDIVLANKIVLQKSIYRWLLGEFLPEDMYIFITLLKKMYPSNAVEIENYFMKNNSIHPCNMFLCKKELFDEFAEWQFNFLFELEKFIRFSDYSRPKRIMGYFGETLLNVFCIIKKLKIKEMPIISMIGDHNTLLQQSSIRKVFNTLDYWYNCKRDKVDNYAIENGLRADGIYDALNNWK